MLDLVADDLIHRGKMQATNEGVPARSKLINLLLHSGGKRIRPSLALLAGWLHC